MEEDDSALSSHALSHLQNVGEADILVGIPCYNNVLTASYVISQVVKGLDTYFPGMRSVIFVSDGNSADGTLTAVKTVHLPSEVNLIPAVYLGISGKGSAVKAVFEAAKCLNVKAVALVDSDLRSITPEWMNLLVTPALSGTGLVVPLYNRRKYDGTITNQLCYPVTASLYGKNVRQPIGGDFGLSIELVESLLESSMWRIRDVRMFGVDIFETHTALAEMFEVKQAFLGIKEHEPKDPVSHLGSMFREVVGTMFTCIEKYETAWKETHGISDVDQVGEEKHVNMQKPLPIDPQSLMTAYAKGFDTYLPLYKYVLSHDVLSEFEKLRNLEKTPFSFPPEAWAKSVYTFIAKFHRTVVPSERGGLLEALRILWLGRLASFAEETLELNPEKTEEKIVEQARTFVALKPFLLDVY